MTTVYPALKMNMGKWKYYVLRMRMEDVAKHIRYANEVHENKSLATHIQRAINHSRVKKQIVKYLSQNEQRFFGSIVVAGLDGNPEWFEVKAENQPEFAMFRDRLVDTFGLITFDDSLKTYALDGQHRLSAIRELINAENTEYSKPDGFEDETISIIYLEQQEGQDREGFMKDFRRVFASLNRHAKPVAKNVIVIMDEDDRFAIATRHLTTFNDFFNSSMEDEEEGASTTICDFEKSSESLPRTSDALLTIVGLYKMATNLLWVGDFQQNYNHTPDGTLFNQLIQEAPTDEESDILNNSLSIIWDGIVETFPILKEAKPSDYRKLHLDDKDNEMNSLIFRPIGQTNIIAPVVRRLLDNKNISHPNSVEEVINALKPMKKIPLDLLDDLWRDFLVVNTDGEYNMRNESRTQVLAIARNIVDWLLCLEPLTEEGIEQLKVDWSSFLIPPGDNEREEKTFQRLLEIRSEIATMNS